MLENLFIVYAFVTIFLLSLAIFRFTRGTDIKRYHRESFMALLWPLTLGLALVVGAVHIMKGPRE